MNSSDVSRVHHVSFASLPACLGAGWRVLALGVAQVATVNQTKTTGGERVPSQHHRKSADLLRALVMGGCVFEYLHLSFIIRNMCIRTHVDIQHARMSHILRLKCSALIRPGLQ